MDEEEDFDSWDAEDFDPNKGFVKKEENDEWKDEDKEIAALLEKEAQPKRPVETVPKKTKEERIEEKKAQRRAEESMKKEEKPHTADSIAEKMRLQKVQEDADLALSKDLFGVSGTGIDGMNPRTQEEFDTFREAVENKLKSLELSPLYVSFLERLLRDVAVSLDVEDIRRLSNSLTHVANEKQKAAKGTKGKKKGGAKVSLAGGKATKKSTIVDHDDFNDMGAEFDDFM